jgi:hypothetical protein
MTLSPKLPGSKKVSFIFTQNQPDPHLFETPVRTFMHMTGLTGLSVKDYLLACNLDAGIKPPVTENREFMEKAYRMGRELLE